MPVKQLSPGDVAPKIQGRDQNGKIVSLSDFLGQKLVVFFYPKDNTPTCTKEACNLRDNYQSLLDAGYQVMGVSADSEKSHRKFIEKYKLPYPLIADSDQTWVKAFGVWGEKQMFGRKYMGIIRATFVLDEKGKITRIIEKVKSGEHAAQILA